MVKFEPGMGTLEQVFERMEKEREEDGPLTKRLAEISGKLSEVEAFLKDVMTMLTGVDTDKPVTCPKYIENAISVSGITTNIADLVSRIAELTYEIKAVL